MATYLSKQALAAALPSLKGRADHLLKIWFVLKRMGLAVGSPAVRVTTPNPTTALKELFAYGEPAGRLFVPFSHTARFSTMEHDAARSIIQTNIRRWQESASVVTVKPNAFLSFELNTANEVLI